MYRICGNTDTYIHYSYKRIYAHIYVDIYPYSYTHAYICVHMYTHRYECMHIDICTLLCYGYTFGDQFDIANTYDVQFMGVHTCMMI
jgi:hypothetical protein